MRRENGSVIGVDNTPTTSVASGVWSLFEQARYQKEGVWPLFSVSEPYFKNTTLLLHGDGTNGAQNNTFLDSSTNNFTITRNGNTTQGTFSPFSQDDGKWGAYFDGNGDYLTVSSSTNTSFNADFTVECWAYLNATSGLRPLVTFGDYSSTGCLFYVTTGGAMAIYLNNSLIVSGGAVSANTWNHFAFVRSGSTITLYLNGTSVGTVTNSSTSGGDARIGVDYYGATITHQLNGYISNLRAVKGTAVYTSAFTPSTTPLTAISGTELLTCQSNRFKDNSANNFAITVNGNTSIQPFSPFAPSAAYSAATNGGSGYFDGSGDYLSIADNAAFEFGSGNFTIEGWINPSALPTGLSSIVTKSDGTGGAYAPYLIGRSNSNIIVRMSSSGSSWDIANAVSFGTLTVGQWFHFALVRNGTTITGYLNGVGTTIATTSASLWDNSNALLVGAIFASSSYIESWNGYISNVRLVKGTAVYTSNFTPPTSPVTAITNTSLLLNFTNAGILDNTGRNDLETVGNAQISTSVKKFGTGSLAFDGIGDYIAARMTPEVVFGSGDMTIECWVYANTISGIDTIFDTRTSGSFGNESFTFQLNAGVPQAWAGSYSSGTPVAQGSAAISTSTWTHIAFTRASGTNRLFVNGTSVASNSNSWTQTLVTSNPYYIGQTVGIDRPFDGYIDDLRITKGVARYTSNFTPPTAAFEDQ